MKQVTPEEIYRDLALAPGFNRRPYTLIDMVATIDGKILSGDRNDPVVDLGSPLDHALMKRIAAQADAVMLGAQTLRTTLASWDPGTAIRVVVTQSGRLPYESKFFGGGRAYVATSNSAKVDPPAGVEVLRSGEQRADLSAILQQVRDRGAERLLVLGGSELNAQLLSEDLVDELFLTIAPKVKLGRDVPTYADGEALPRKGLLRFQIVESHVVGDEVFLRYRRGHGVS